MNFAINSGKRRNRFRLAVTRTIGRSVHKSFVKQLAPQSRRVVKTGPIIKNVIDFGFGIITVRFNFSRKVLKGRKLLYCFLRESPSAEDSHQGTVSNPAKCYLHIELPFSSPSVCRFCCRVLQIAAQTASRRLPAVQYRKHHL